MLPDRSVAIPISGMDELERRPTVVLQLFNRESNVVTPALIEVLRTGQLGEWSTPTVAPFRPARASSPGFL